MSLFLSHIELIFSLDYLYGLSSVVKNRYCVTMLSTLSPFLSSEILTIEKEEENKKLKFVKVSGRV